MAEYLNKNLAWHHIKLAMPSSERENLKKAFDKIPTIDVQEVKHGKWEYEGQILGLDTYKCSLCKKDEFGMSNYCPNCGAKMDGK